MDRNGAVLQPSAHAGIHYGRFIFSVPEHILCLEMRDLNELCPDAGANVVNPISHSVRSATQKR